MFRSDPIPNHRTCRKLLPWYVNGTLEAVEREDVERHLEGCETCREEITSLEVLRQHVRATRDPAPTELPATARGLEQVWDSIDGGAAARFRPSPVVRGVLVAQAAAILVLVSLLAWPAAPRKPNTYRMLSDLPAAAVHAEGSLRIVFGEGATELEIRRLLRSVGAEIVGGPTQVGAYTLRVRREAPRGAALLALLRADPLVRLVEPIFRR